MATLGNYFIDAPTLAGATAVFTDADMTILAPDGFYSDGTTVREQIGGLLSISVVCPSCVLPCGTGVNATGNAGVYELSFSAGSNVGCTIIYFEPFSIPDAIRVQYNGATFNELTSPSFGYLASSASPNNYTFIGDTADDCGIAAQLAGGGYSGLNQYVWNGASFDLIGTGGTVTGAAGDVQLTAADPLFSTLYVPKNNVTPEIMTVEMVGVCGSTAFNVEINCPVQLTGVPTSLLGGACVDELPNTYYNVPNRGGTAGEPALREFFVQDPFGNSRVSAGPYVINPPSGKKEITVDVNGVITSISSCPP
tara:strand:- start:1312 stop:2238 length:927 start_codon:yes stop_codon:yes gene_type:complete